MDSCVFCSVVAHNEPFHEIWWSDGTHIAFLDANPVQKGHTLIIPKKHTGNILDLSDEEYKTFLLAAKKVASELRRFFEIERVGMIVEGFGVDHVHIHLIPLHKRGDLGVTPIYPMTVEEFSMLGGELRDRAQ